MVTGLPRVALPASSGVIRAPKRSGSASYSSIQRCTSALARSISTDDARNSITSFRERCTRSVSVVTFMPASAVRLHAGTSVREPSTSTTHTRHAFTGVRFSA